MLTTTQVALPAWLESFWFAPRGAESRPSGGSHFTPTRHLISPGRGKVLRCHLAAHAPAFPGWRRCVTSTGDVPPAVEACPFLMNDPPVVRKLTPSTRLPPAAQPRPRRPSPLHPPTLCPRRLQSDDDLPRLCLVYTRGGVKLTGPTSMSPYSNSSSDGSGMSSVKACFCLLALVARCRFREGV
jgi:hypothetical protein